MELKRLLPSKRLSIIVGFAIRGAMIALFVPVTYAVWFVPFLTFVASHWGSDPWSDFLAMGGPAVAFPYGPPYIAVFGPLTWLGAIVGPRGAAFGLGITVLALDWATLRMFVRLFGRDKEREIIYAYWLSPIVIFVCYWHGQLDLLPVLLLTVGLLGLRNRKAFKGGFGIGLATAAKFSMGLAIPFVMIASWTTARLRPLFKPLLAGSIAGIVIALPPLLSAGYRTMVLDTPETAKAFGLAISYTNTLSFYIAPLVILGLLYAAARVRKFNFEILFTFVGLGFFSLFLLTPASPGWILWLMPFLVFHAIDGTRRIWLLIGAFSFLFIAFHLTASSGPTGYAAVAPVLDVRTRNILLSLYLAAGGAVMFQFLRHGLFNNPFYRNTREPLLVGIAGDSGAGKDTLAEATIGLFGNRASALVSGDDYHFWDRHKPMWRALTHLNPRANDLRRFVDDTLQLANGQTITAPHYDHSLGSMTKPRKIWPGEVIVAAGLHALFSRELVNRYDLRIYLAPDEGLRRYLKIRRDVQDRGYPLENVLAALKRREADSERFIRPQAQAADLIFALNPLDPAQIADPRRGPASPQLVLAIEIDGLSDTTPLITRLVSLAGVSVLEEEGHYLPTRLVVSGEASVEDIEAVAHVLVPAMFDHLALKPNWKPGLLGIMQVTILHQLNIRLARNGASKSWTF